MGTAIGDTYTVVDVLGQGGMGAVYLANHARLPGKQVAIKVLHADMATEEVLARFRREAEIASRLGHPNIVTVLDWNTLPDGSPYLVLEYLRGQALADKIAAGPLPILEALTIARQVGSALVAAHREGIVHRDLKPQNVFLVDTEIDGQVSQIAKVLDFGISKIRGSTTVKTQDNAMLGTPQYMAPEQATGRADDIDGRTDQFALALMVYEMLCGKPAFTGANIPEVMFKIVYEAPPPLRELRHDVPANIEAAIHRALQKPMADRFASVDEFIAALTGSAVAGGVRPVGAPSRSHAQAALAATMDSQHGAVSGFGETTAQSGPATAPHRNDRAGSNAPPTVASQRPAAALPSEVRGQDAQAPEQAVRTGSARAESEAAMGATMAVARSSSSQLSASEGAAVATRVLTSAAPGSATQRSALRRNLILAGTAMAAALITWRMVAAPTAPPRKPKRGTTEETASPQDRAAPAHAPQAVITADADLRARDAGPPPSDVATARPLKDAAPALSDATSGTGANGATHTDTSALQPPDTGANGSHSTSEHRPGAPAKPSVVKAAPVKGAANADGADTTGPTTEQDVSETPEQAQWRAYLIKAKAALAADQRTEAQQFANRVYDAATNAPQLRNQAAAVLLIVACRNHDLSQMNALRRQVSKRARTWADQECRNVAP